jgi:L-alanine-DL-glutamate epimerase-like enolase superfamily enzyme
VGARLEAAEVYLQYLEQPVRIDSFGTYKRLQERLQTPIVVNEDMYHSRNLYHLARKDAINVAVVDVVPAGGLLALKKLVGIAAEASVSVAHHSAFDLGIKTAAVVHLAASTPSINLPSDSVYYALTNNVIESPFEIEDGAIEVRDAPGLGITMNEDEVDRHRLNL